MILFYVPAEKAVPGASVRVAADQDTLLGYILGWSAATTIRMAKRYGHIGDEARVRALDLLAS